MNKQVEVQPITDGEKITAINFHIEGEHVADKFPKACKVKDSWIYGCVGVARVPFSFMRVDFSADDVNKGKNETGIKRLKRFVAEARKQGYTVNLPKELETA